jgi:hypothetical protein
LQFSPTKRRCHPTLRNRVSINERTTSEPATNEPATTEPATKVRASKVRVVSKKKKKRVTYESVGVDKEGIYTDSLIALSDSSYDTDLATSSDSDADLATSSDSDANSSDPEFDPDGK